MIASLFRALSASGLLIFIIAISSELRSRGGGEKRLRDTECYVILQIAIYENGPTDIMEKFKG
jgi:hypothetical protein